MVRSVHCGCDAGSLVAVPRAGRPSTAHGVIRCGRQPVVSFERRIEQFDLLKLRLATKEASTLRRVHETMTPRLRVTADAASQALQENASALFGDVCVNPRALSSEAAEFMLSVAASQSLLSRDESQEAGHVDLTLRGVHPGSFGAVLLVCTTTMFAAAVTTSDVEKAFRRAELWRKAVGSSFSVLPVVAGYSLPQEVAGFAAEAGVLCCDVTRERNYVIRRPCEVPSLIGNKPFGRLDEVHTLTMN